MARNISASALAKLATDLGTEPIIIVQVYWGGGTSEMYADRTIAGTPVKGRILDMSGFDEVVQISGGGQSQNISVTLDDSDGHLRSLFDTIDIHKKAVRVWQWFEGIDFDDKFLIFKGEVNSPVVWQEGMRQLKFSIVNRIEDVEVGFSAEEGQFPTLSEDLIGRPWPLCFGTCINVPALKAVPSISGTLSSGVGIKDFTLKRRLALANAITCPTTMVGFTAQYCGAINAWGGQSVCFEPVYETDKSCIQARCVEIERLTLMLQEQSSYEFKRITVIGGEKMQQGETITLNINGGLFTGKFDGTLENPSNEFVISSRQHPKNDGSGNVIEDETETQIKSTCGPGEDYNHCTQAEDVQETIFGKFGTGTCNSQKSWALYRDEPSADFFWADGGSNVTLDTAHEIVYIANILPSVIHRVAAYRTVNGRRLLLDVPEDYYEVRQTDYTGYQVMEIVFQRPLSVEGSETGGGWEDDIYVTLTSSVGPNTVDIVRWFIETYTDYAIDETSFNAVEARVENYPMHFPLLTRKNLLNVLQEISNKARCALWLKDDTFYMRYLSSEPTGIESISEDDIIKDSLSIELTKTEDLVTKLTATWKIDYALEKPNKLILRHNVSKYGTQESDDDYYQFNILDLVRKSATFWLIRRSNTWKRIKFSTSVEFLNLEAFDPVEFTLDDVADGTFIGIIEKAFYNSNDNTIEFEAWTPIRAGTRIPYNFAWPADINEHVLFPTIEERLQGLAGSGTEPNFSTIAPPGHPLETPQNYYTSASLACNGNAVESAQVEGSDFAVESQCRQDHGDKNPSDVGDEKPEPPRSDSTQPNGDVSVGTSPIANGTGSGFWSKEQTQKEESDRIGGQAANAASEAQRAVNNDPSDPQDFGDAFDELPDPDDLDEDEHPCQVRVVVTGFRTRLLNPSVCVPDGASFEEIYVFNSTSAAQALQEAMQDQSNCSGVPPCGFCINASLSGGPCEPPEGQDPSILAFRTSQPETDPIISELN